MFTQPDILVMTMNQFYYEELLERLRLGIMPLIREGSSERNVGYTGAGIVKNNLPT